MTIARLLSLILVSVTLTTQAGARTHFAPFVNQRDLFWQDAVAQNVRQITYAAVNLMAQEKARPPARTQTVKGNPVTRGKVAQMIYEAFKTTLFKADKPGENAPFKDVPAADPDFKIISILSQHGIFSGDSEGNFHAETTPSRYEMAQTLDALLAALKLTNTKALLAFTLAMPKDIPQSAPAYKATERMLKLEALLPFDDGYFRGKRATTDAEVADAITRIQELAKAYRPASLHGARRRK